jgi:uncharacterized protein (TIGR03083 family)
MRLAAAEYDRFAAAVRDLAPDDWTARTACPAWDVRALAGHVLGMAELAASPVEGIRQMRAARRRGGLFIDALTAVQVDKHARRSPAEIAERLTAVGPRAARGRRRTPGLLRRRPMPEPQPVDDKGERVESWTFGYLIDVVLTRDTWMHRMDVAAATGRPAVVTADHDGVLVADVVAEWAARHGRPYTLVLTGPAGGTWSGGEGGPALELDAVEFCRILSGRGAGDGLLAERVPF